MIKHLNATVKASPDDGFPGTFEAVASAETLDRDGEIVAKNAFSPLPARIPIHVDHRMDSEGLVGTGRPFYSGDVLKVVGNFAGTPRAQIVRQLVREGHLNSMSVGFYAPTRRDIGGVPTIVKAELLEVSFVTVPSNRESLVMSSRGYRSNADRAFAKAQVTAARATVLLAEMALDDYDKATPQKSARRIVAEAERLLRQLKGTR